jgi:hypothetical protein
LNNSNKKHNRKFPAIGLTGHASSFERLRGAAYRTKLPGLERIIQ